MQRIGVNAAEVTSGALTLTIPAAVVAGDLLVALVAEQGGYPTLLTTPPGWSRLANEGASARGGTAFARIAVEGDAGAAVVFANTSISRTQGAIVAYRGGISANANAIAADADAFRVVVHTTGTASHVALPTVGYQSEDVRLILWANPPGPPSAFTAPVAAGYTTLAQSTTYLLGEYLAGAPGTSGGLTATAVAGTAASMIISATLHARPVARPRGLSAGHSGHIGLVA